MVLNNMLLAGNMRPIAQCASMKSLPTIRR